MALAAALARFRGVAGAGAPELATVTACRSWDGRVHLQLADGRSGLCVPEPRGFALAAAAQAAGRPVHVRCWGHDAAAEGGVGCFAGALLALDPADLATDDDRTNEVQP
ncbi:MAG: hypothetical protein KF830_17050 [Planctomycetes bacterium]|nr:hypothetical protein [Planctomycetota bacterium]